MMVDAGEFAVNSGVSDSLLSSLEHTHSLFTQDNASEFVNLSQLGQKLAYFLYLLGTCSRR